MVAAPRMSRTASRIFSARSTPAAVIDGSSSRRMARCVNDRAQSANSSSRSAACRPPTSAPIDEPAIPTIWYPRSCSSWITPIWAYPRAPPLPSASATRGRDESRSASKSGMRSSCAGYAPGDRHRVRRRAASARGCGPGFVSRDPNCDRQPARRQPHSSLAAAWAATITAAWRADGSAPHGVFQVPGPAAPGAWSAAK